MDLLKLVHKVRFTGKIGLFQVYAGICYLVDVIQFISLCANKSSEPARIRTWNLLIRSQTRYPLRHRSYIVTIGVIFKENYTLYMQKVYPYI